MKSRHALLSFLVPVFSSVLFYTHQVAQAEEVIPGEYIVKFKEPFLNKLTAEKLEIIHSQDQQNKILHHFTTVKNLKHLKLTAKNLASLKKFYGQEIDYIEPVYRVWADNDDSQMEVEDFPFTSKQWGMENTKDIDINIMDAWASTQGDASIVVGVVDTGVDYNHPAIKNHLWKNENEIPGNNKDDDGNGYVDDIFGWDFYSNDAFPNDLSSHGTHVSGVISSELSTKNFIGVAPGVRLMPLRFLGGNGSGSSADAIKAIDYGIRNGAKILNNSWGGGGYSQALKDVIIKAQQNGILFVTSAGNKGINLDSSPKYPASYGLENMVVVAAVNSQGIKNSASNYGPTTVHIGAPGSSIYSTLPKGSYGYMSGTSMASPFVAAVAALIWSSLPDLTYAEVKEILLKSARPLSSLKGKTISGGMVNAGSALE